MGPYIVQATFGYYKLWSSDSGRNLAGTQSGTLIGIFPKIIIEFRPDLTKDELNKIATILDKANQTVEYFDANKSKKITMTTYTGDWELVNTSINKNKGFNCSFISVRKRA